MIPKRRIILFSAIILFGFLVLVLFKSNGKPPVKKRAIVKTTTTTTTPTPPDVLLHKNVRTRKDITIQKYDPLQVYYKIIKSKLDKMTRRSNTGLSEAARRFNMTNENVHMFYVDRLITKKKPILLFNDTVEEMILMQNFETARSIGCGVILLEYPQQFISPPLTTKSPHNADKIMSMMNLAKEYGLKISIVIKDYFKRSVFSVRQDIINFLKMYGRHPALYRHKRKDRFYELPVIYVMHSYAVPPDKWKLMLTRNGKLSVRNSIYDIIILGHLQDEEHATHIRKSHFDGFFTCCNRNGDSYGSTWKNWNSLSSWAHSRNILWSAGVVEGAEGTVTIKTALNTVMKSNPRPDFVSFDGARHKDTSITAIREWNVAWSNKKQ